MAIGIDLAGDSANVINEIRAAHLDFVIRYYRKSSSHYPTLTASEAHLLSQASLQVVAIWESASDSAAYFTHVAGVNDATNAFRQAHTIGQPGTSAIYFAVDFDASVSEVKMGVTEYFRGIAAGFQAATAGGAAGYKIGVYGSGAVCHELKSAGLAELTWMAMSTGWRGSQTYTDWSIKQGPRRHDLSFDHDSDEAKNGYGNFRI